MKPFLYLVAALTLLTACQSGASPTIPAQQPGLQQHFGDRTLIMDGLLVQGQTITIPVGLQASIAFGSDGQVTGSGGCNRFFSHYASPQPGQLTISGLGSTKMHCTGQMDVEIGLFQVLQQAARYEITGESLVILSADGKYRASFYEPPVK